ncbi:hypothetical protein L218DRAFT_862521 [Marasmius fiardii PR-910]|nr:hypothetical protein L218DRAFT_862521 [Marasmius fiardii PR-910]
MTLSYYNIQRDSTVHLVLKLRGDKPVIYLLSQQEREATVRLSLAPQWEVSALYPVVPITRCSRGKVHQTVQWSVQTRKDNTLIETTTGSEVAYLFWEARSSLPEVPPSPPPSPRLDNRTKETFVPNNPQITPQTSVILSIEALPAYLEKVLKALAFHTEARTSFITYWLPSFLRHKHIALRFLPQSAYEEAAPLDVTPAPDVVTRIFMLFRGITEEELKSEEEGVWGEAAKRSSSEDGVAYWQNIVGVDMAKSTNEDLFRVLEWGGMEVF